MKSLDGVKLVKKPVHKTEARLVAETSLLSAYTFAVTDAVTHFVVGERSAGYVPLATPDAGVMSTGTPSGRKSLLDMVSEANDFAVCARNERATWIAYLILLDTMTEIGLPTEDSKNAPPNSLLLFLGFTLDTVKQAISLPEEKTTDILR